MSDTATTEKTRKTPDPRQVNYTIEFVDELPGGENLDTRRSPIEDNLAAIVANTDAHGRWVLIAQYGKPTAAAAAANVLRQKHGRDISVEGWEFTNRKTTDTESGNTFNGLYVRYNPDAIVAGAKEQHDAWLKERDAELEARRVEREAAKAKAEGNGGSGGGQATGQTPRETEGNRTAEDAEKKAPRK